MNANDTCEHGLAAWLCAGPSHYPLDRDDDFFDGPRLWDVGEGVCCAAFQLGACDHTEAYNDDYDYGDEGPDDVCELVTLEGAELVDDPF